MKITTIVLILILSIFALGCTNYGQPDYKINPPNLLNYTTPHITDIKCDVNIACPKELEC